LTASDGSHWGGCLTGGAEVANRTMWSEPFTEADEADDREAEAEFDSLGGRAEITGYKRL